MSSQIPTGSWRIYDANFKLMVIREAEATNNCMAGRKFGISEVNIRKWWQMKEKLRNVNSSRKSFSGPKEGEISWVGTESYEVHAREKEWWFADHMRGDTDESAGVKAQAFTARVGWCVRMMKRAGLTLWRQTTLTKVFLQNMQRNLSHFNATWLIYENKHNYLLGQICNADQMPVYFNIKTENASQKRRTE